MAAGTVALFAKHPTPGAAKTRLIPALGAERAAQLADAFLTDLLARLAQELPADIRLVLCFDPPTAAPHFAARVQASVELLPQVSGGLGERLAAVRCARPGPLAFIGSDAPDLPLDEIATGFQHAAHGQAYLMHAADGGYVLLTLPGHAPAEVFDAITWSAADTALQQREKLSAHNIGTVVSARTWWDVDEPADLLPLRRRLEAAPHVAPLTLELLRALDR